MNNTTVGFFVLAILCCFFLSREILAFYKRHAVSKQATTDAMLKLATSLDKSAETGTDATKLLAGTLKACEAIAAATVELQAEISSFRKLVGSGKKDANYPEDNYQPPPGEAEINKTHAYIEAVLRGIPAQQAQAEADAMEEKKTMLSAVSYGPGDEN